MWFCPRCTPCARRGVAAFGAAEMRTSPTRTSCIVRRVAILREPESARALAVVLALGAVAVLVIDRLVRGRPRPVRTGQGSPRPPMRWRLGWTTPLWLALSAAITAAALAVPLWITASGLISNLGGQGTAVDWPMLRSATLNTVQWAGWAALVATLCALPITLLAVRFPGRLSSLIERSVWVAHALPGVIMALALACISVQWLFPQYPTAALRVIGQSGLNA